MTAKTQQTVPLRANAQLNRERILQAAWEALLESTDASLNSIAKKAGVGIGTLYRHFPTREALVLEVYRHEVQNAADAAPALLERLQPLDALREWMERLAQYGMTKVGLADALSSVASHKSLAAEAYEPIIGALSLLLRANDEAGTIRPGLDPDDVLLIMGFLWRIDPRSDWRSRSSRLLDILMDGLKAGAPRPPGAGGAGCPLSCPGGDRAAGLVRLNPEGQVIQLLARLLDLPRPAPCTGRPAPLSGDAGVPGEPVAARARRPRMRRDIPVINAQTSAPAQSPAGTLVVGRTEADRPDRPTRWGVPGGWPLLPVLIVQALLSLRLVGATPRSRMRA